LNFALAMARRAKRPAAFWRSLACLAPRCIRCEGHLKNSGCRSMDARGRGRPPDYAWRLCRVKIPARAERIGASQPAADSYSGTSMTIFTSEMTFSTPSRFRVLVNGFADRALFPTLHDAVGSIPAKGVDGLSFEIYDAIERQYVWTRPRQKDSRTCPAAFSIRVKGYPTGLSFASMDEAIDSISVRPHGDECGVFENETCVFMRNPPRGLELEEAL